jgi:hypothetical protein
VCTIGARFLEILQQFSHLGQLRHSSVARTLGNPEMQSVGGDDSKEADIPDKWAPIKSYAPWKPHKLLKIG